MKKALPILVAILTGLVMVLDFFFVHPVLDPMGRVLLQWAVIVTAFAMLTGLLNIFLVHASRVFRREKGWGYSIVVVLAMWTVIVFGFIDPAGPHGLVVSWVFRYVQYPLQATVMALLAFFALSAGYRVFQKRSPEATIMLLSASLVLLGYAAVVSDLGGPVSAIKDWIISVPAMAGVRGILLGVALGIIAAGLRIVVGMDRPYTD
ncbi:MAG: hypothetical protein RMK30_08915 [Anaerolineae bacterium]|nr:hypothetical protein [Anaerolineae bacterium]MDW8102983.1 hypothetical protein [Anaerolineae bacterium]